MTKLHLVVPGPVLTLTDIGAFEQNVGRIPADYREFLLTQNGGAPDPEIGFSWEGDIQEVGKFYRFPKECRRTMKELRRLGVDGFLPVAWTTNEESVCLSLRNDFGTVFLAQNVRKDYLTVRVNMVVLAKSFNKFVSSLVEIPNPYCPIVEMGKRGTPDMLADYLSKGHSIEAVGKYGWTIVCEAIKFNNRPMIQACIERGASLSGTIHLAVQNTRTDLIEELINAGADLNERDKYGRTPFDYHGGTGLPGERGARKRELQTLLLHLGALRTTEFIDVSSFLSRDE